MIGYAAGMVAMLVLLAKDNAGAGKLRLRGQRWERRNFAEILGVGLLSSLSAIQTVLSALILTGVVARFGVDALAGDGVGVRLELLMVPLTFAVGAALVPLTGTHVGAGQHERAKRIAWAGAGLDVVFMCIAAGLLAWAAITALAVKLVSWRQSA